MRRGGRISKLTVSVLPLDILFRFTYKICSMGIRISHRSVPSTSSSRENIFASSLFWRRGGDSNSRDLSAHRVSSAAHSTTLTPLQIYFAIAQICCHFDINTFCVFFKKCYITVCISMALSSNG